MTVASFPPVQQRLMEFIRHRFDADSSQYNVLKLLGDASSRQYFRVVDEHCNSFVIAAYPEPFDPDRFTYHQVYLLLREAALPVPQILGMDGSLGIVLQEDLGDESLQRRLLTGNAEEATRFIEEAVRLLIDIQCRCSPLVKPDTDASRLAFDEEKLTWELHFFRRHYGGYRQIAFEPLDSISSEFDRLAAGLAAYPRFLCHRDYHVRNLMIKDERLHIIDFQDARQGPALYDLVSLLKDSIQLSAEEVDRLISYYIGQCAICDSPALEIGESSLRRQFDLMTIQRLLKALGTYGYQITQRGNFIYEQYIEGSLNRALDALRSVGEFPYIQAVVEEESARYQQRT